VVEAGGLVNDNHPMGVEAAARRVRTQPPFGVGLRGNRWNELDGLWPERAPTISVIVVHYNQQAELDRTLLALSRQTYPSQLVEVVVVDDGSEVRPTMSHGARLIEQADEGFRLAAARNLGVRSSTGEILCFLDADTAPEPDYLRRLTRLPALAPEAVTVGRRRHTRFDEFDPGVPVELGGPAHELAEPRWLIDAYASSRDLLDSDNRSYRFVIGAVVACSRWFFTGVGGFDESFTRYGGEDWEWANRAWLCGAVFAHVPDAVAWHNGPEWNGRSSDDAERRRRKNAETLQLAQTIAVRGSAPGAVTIARNDVVFALGSAISEAAAFVCVDSILRVIPQARVRVPGPVPEIFGFDPRVSASTLLDTESDGPRVHVDIQNAVLLQTPDAPCDTRIAWAIEAVGVGDLGQVVFTDELGATLMTVTSSRARHRWRRWNDRSLFETRVEHASWLTRLTEEPSVAAYLGGWL
jgi:GT2 family glycosyltransferase